MADTILTVTTQQIGVLDAKRAVELVAGLLRAELRRLGVPITHAHISMRINAPDGGVDASVDTDPIEDAAWLGSFIPDERTALQIKTGDAFRPWQQSEVKKELFGKTEPAKEALGTSVRDCLEAAEPTSWSALALIQTNGSGFRPKNISRRTSSSADIRLPTSRSGARRHSLDY